VVSEASYTFAGPKKRLQALESGIFDPLSFFD
jgi:hypothetical protein